MNYLDTIANVVNDHPNYRVLRRLQPLTTTLAFEAMVSFSGRYADDAGVRDPGKIKTALVLDTETTGLDTATCKIIEIGVRQIGYDANGVICGAGQGASWLEDPHEPLTSEVVRVTGLTDAELVGKTIPDHKLESMARDATVIIAHHANFDRPVVERRFPFLADKCWACSMEAIDWKAMGAPSASLANIAAFLGYFFDAHRAAGDVEALASILALSNQRNPSVTIGEHRTFLSMLLEQARQPTVRIWATNAPFDSKDKLKSRGYRWHDGTTGRAKCWYRDTDPEDVDAEIGALQADGLCRNPTIAEFTARDRYSARALA